MVDAHCCTALAAAAERCAACERARKGAHHELDLLLRRLESNLLTHHPQLFRIDLATAARAARIQGFWDSVSLAIFGVRLFRLLGVWIVEPAVLIEHLKCGAKYELLFLRHFVLPWQPTSVKQ